MKKVAVAGARIDRIGLDGSAWVVAIFSPQPNTTGSGEADMPWLKKPELCRRRHLGRGHPDGGEPSDIFVVENQKTRDGRLDELMARYQWVGRRHQIKHRMLRKDLAVWPLDDLQRNRRTGRSDQADASINNRILDVAFFGEGFRAVLHPWRCHERVIDQEVGGLLLGQLLLLLKRPRHRELHNTCA